MPQICDLAAVAYPERTRRISDAKKKQKHAHEHVLFFAIYMLFQAKITYNKEYKPAIPINM
jgi:hypothetical protein